MFTGKVIALELVQSNEVKSSYHMELEGLKRIVSYLGRNDLSIREIITDRHLQIQKWIRENLPGTTHSYDVWHVAKAVKKKLLAVSKDKECAIVGKWIKSITNHLYWSAASSRGESGEVIAAKWSSVVNHVENIHTGHNSIYPNCDHGPLEQKREWVIPGTKAAAKLEDVLQNTRLKKDIKKLSTGFQTSTLEAFHSALNQFAPKMYSYSYQGQKCRQYIAALHFNENVKRGTKMSADGTPQIKISYPKYKGADDFSVRYLSNDMTFRYVEELLSVTMQLIGKNSSLSTSAPPPLTNGKRRPSKEEALQTKSSRYKKLKY